MRYRCFLLPAVLPRVLVIFYHFSFRGTMLTLI